MALMETVYCSQLTGFINVARPDLVCRLNRSMYGLKQAPRAWYSRFASYLASIGFVKAKSNMSMFIYQRGADTVYLLLYVDDIVLTASTADLLQRTIVTLQWEFTTKDLGPLHHFLGITAERRPQGFLPPPTPARHRHPRAGCHVRLQALLHTCRHSGEAL
jgi:hypothetical protein